jgi:hypothetical protein
MRKRLENKSINKYRQSKKRPDRDQISKSVRGSLHEDTLYGKITIDTGEEKYVTRKEVRSLNEKQIDSVVDLGIRDYLKNLIKENSGGWSDVIRHPIYFNGRPLRRVRWMASDTSMPLLRRETKTYATPGNNLLMVVYQDEGGHRAFETVSFYQGVLKKKNKELLYPSTVGDKKILFDIKPFDKFLWCEHADELNFEEPEDIQKRLYHVIKFTGNSIYLGQSHVANVKADYDKKPIKIFCTHSSIKAIKIKLDILGRIVWRSDQGYIQA